MQLGKREKRTQPYLLFKTWGDASQQSIKPQPNRYTIKITEYNSVYCTQVLWIYRIRIVSTGALSANGTCAQLPIKTINKA